MEEAAKQAQQAAERAKRLSLWGSLVLLAVAVFAGVQSFQANHQGEAVTAQTLALRANALVAKHEGTKAALLAALSLEVRPTQEAKDSAIAMLSRQEFRSLPLRGHEDRVLSVAFSSDGTRIVSGSGDKTVVADPSATSTTCAQSMTHANKLRRCCVYCGKVAPFRGTRPNGADHRSVDLSDGPNTYGCQNRNGCLLLLAY